MCRLHGRTLRAASCTALAHLLALLAMVSTAWLAAARTSGLGSSQRASISPLKEIAAFPMFPRHAQAAARTSGDGSSRKPAIMLEYPVLYSSNFPSDEIAAHLTW